MTHMVRKSRKKEGDAPVLAFFGRIMRFVSFFPFFQVFQYPKIPELRKNTAHYVLQAVRIYLFQG